MVVDPIVSLSGELDVFTAPTACRPLRAIDGPAVIDLSGVSLLSAAALSELAAVARRAGRGTVALTGPNPDVRRVLEICRFDELFTIVDASR